jgi:colicin import membrane protein
MSAAIYETPNEKVISGALALVMHLLFFALLVFGVAWQKRQSDAMVAELWSSLPQPAPRAEPPPPPKAAPEPPAPAPKAQAKPVPRAEPKPQPRADIDLREKKEKERKAREQALAEKKKRAEQEQLAALKRQQAAEAADARRLAQEQADAKRREKEQAEALKKLAAERAAAHAREVEKYRLAIAGRIRRFIIEPPNLQGNPEAELDIIVLPGGEVLDVRTRRPSGQAAWDNAVERAIRRAQPLPLPADPALAKEFRELNLKFRPKE